MGMNFDTKINWEDESKEPNKEELVKVEESVEDEETTEVVSEENKKIEKGTK
jgi:hypothetical protein